MTGRELGGMLQFVSERGQGERIEKMGISVR